MIAFDYNYQNTPNTNINQRFEVNFKPTSRPVLEWKQELLISIKDIPTKKPIYLCMSGGIDSEVVAQLLIQSKIKFKAITFKHIKGTNQNDTCCADEFCKANNIEQISIYFEPEYLFKDGVEKYIKQGYRSINIYHYLQLFMLETVTELGGYALGGAGEMVFHTVDDQICLKMNPCYTLGMDWCKNNNVHHNLWFFHSSPEIYASYLNLELISFLLNDPSFFVSHHYASNEKRIIYHQHWPRMMKREKLSGFGNIRKTIREPVEEILKKKFPDLQDLYLPVNVMKQQLGI
jgi:hypothetical protein